MKKSKGAAAPAETVSMQDAVTALEEARRVAIAVQQAAPTRTLDIAITQIESALLWVVQDDKMRAIETAAAAAHDPPPLGATGDKDHARYN